MRFAYWLLMSIAGAALPMQGFAQCGAGIPSGGNPNCIPPSVYHSQGITEPQINAPSQQPIVVHQKWADRWGAMAVDSVNPISGTALSMHSKIEALSLAKSKCFSNGGIKCDNVFEYKNGCGVIMARVGGGVIFTAAATEEMAIDHGMKICAKQNKVCEVYYTGCSQQEAVPIR